MDKKYSDNEVRGERSSRPEQVEKKGLVLSFTKNAWEKYQQLTGSQKTFIDRELDDLKFKRNNQKSKMGDRIFRFALPFSMGIQNILGFRQNNLGADFGVR